MNLCGGSAPGLVFASPVPAHGTDTPRFACRRTEGKETCFFPPNRCYSIRWLPGLPGPDPGHFSLVGKVTKSTHREGTLSMGSLPYGPLPHDDIKGDTCPRLQSPAGLVVVLASFGNSRSCIPRTMFRYAPLETSISLTGRQAKFRCSQTTDQMTKT